MVKKIITIVITRIVELVILYFGGRWLWEVFDEGYRLWIVGALVVAYVVYFVVTFMNDYDEIKHHEEEHVM